MLSRIGSALKDNIPARALQVSNIIRFITSLLVGIILIKIGVEKSIVGRLEFFLFLSMILSNFWIFGFKNGLLSFYEELDPEKKKKLFSTVFILLALLGIVVGGVTWLLGHTLFSVRLNDYDLSSYIVLLALYVGLSIPASFGDYFLLLQSRFKGIVWFGAIFGLLQLFVIVCPFLCGADFSYVFIYLVGLAAVKCMVTWLIISPFHGFHYDKKIASVYVLFSLPLVIHVMLGFLGEFVDGWIVSTFYSEEMFANFRYGAKELPFSLILVSALVASMIPAFKKNRMESLATIKRESARLIKLLFLTGAGLVFLSPLLFELAYDSSFVISAQIFNVYILILLSRVLLPHIIVYGNNKNWILPFVVIVELAVNIGLSLLLLPHFGILGVAFATVVANMVEKLIMVVYVDRKLDVRISQYLDIRVYSTYSILLILAFIGSYLLQN